MSAPAGAADATRTDAARATTQPVLLELFTSEGCSSCPPADALVAMLAKEQPVRGARIVLLGFHVDYWDQLGWRDRFSSAAYTQRQNAYSRAWSVDKVYTPQGVVDGRWEFIASDRAAAEKLLANAARDLKRTVHVSVSRDPADAAHATLAVEVGPAADAESAAKNADLMLAITEDDLVSDVQRGENAKKTLRHVAVVRKLDRIAKLPANAAQQSQTVSYTAKLESDWRLDRLRAVVFVQDASSKRVFGVATTPF